MRQPQTLGQNGATLRPTQEFSPQTAIAPATKDIPYDYVARFVLQGKRGNRVQDVINISVDGAFVAVAIGYSFIPARLPPSPGISLTAALPPPPDKTVEWLLTNLIAPVLDDPRMLAQCLAAKLCGIEFKYSIVDSGSGRELQNQPIHNIAGLGEASGDRPFRPLAKPMPFMPRSTIRIEIEEISDGPLYVNAELYIVLHGYKMLGYGTGLP